MKKIFALSIIMIACIVAGKAQKIKGSDTLLPLSQQEAESYMNSDPSQTVIVTGGGSGTGIAALIEGTTDIAQSSRKIKFEEKQKISEGGKSVKEVVVAFDALAIVVNPENKVTNLTREQLEGIFTGKITNWKEVGGADLKITPYSRETSSGTYEFFKESVLKNKNYKSGILSMPATGAIVQSVGQTKGAIGYIGLAYINKDVKAVHVSYDNGKTFTAPSVASAKDGTYPIVRELYYYYVTAVEKAVRPFIDYVLSPAGQKIVAETGFITL
ncbi:MAG: PstS family phosphate ABC transporter substrate-binding protein [Dysgonamonadaceae bacterium]|nr:PstS family phosphate ABC transporter substrate-binding protein [Dysgonamonadaceae bacterium]